MSLSHHPNIVRNGLVFYSDPANYKSYPSSQDLYVNNVSLMLDFNQNFADKSLNNLTVTSNGSATISSTQSKFGGFSGSFTNSNSYLQITNSSLFNLISSDFTIEAWVYPTTSSGDRVIVAKNQGSYLTGYEWWLGIMNNNTVQFTFTDSNTVFYSAGTVTTVSANTWTHIAAVRSGNTVTVYINGISSATTGSQTIKTTTSDVTIARDLETTGGGGRYFTGYIDDLRITKGYARYTSNFTPPSIPLSLPNTSTDLTRSKIPVSYSSGVTFSNSNAGTMALNGTSAYGSGNNFLSVGPASSFTVCTWVKYNSTVTSGPARCSAVAKAANTNDFEAVLGFPYTYSSSKLGLEVGKAGVQSQTAYSINSNPTGIWYHLCGVFMNGSGNFYINSVYQSTVTYNATVNTASTNSNAWAFGTEPFNGSASGPFVNGNIGPTCIYNRILSNNEILQNYNATKSRYGY